MYFQNVENVDSGRQWWSCRC